MKVSVELWEYAERPGNAVDVQYTEDSINDVIERIRTDYPGMIINKFVIL